jgi:molybdenum cofactor cytidylyltransferase
VTVGALLLASPAESPGGNRYVRRVALAALAALCRPVVAGGPGISGDLASIPVDVIEDGSIRGALEVALTSTPHLDAAVVLRADQSRITAMAIWRLCSSFRNSHAAIVASAYDGTIALPALFARSVFVELLAVPPESGVKPVFAAHARDMISIALPQLGSQIESAEEYALLRVEPTAL